MTRKQRLRMMSEILEKQVIGDQQQLIDAMRREGEVVTQATISRDLKFLDVQKTILPGNKYRYVLPDLTVSHPSTKQHHVAADAVQEIQFSGNFAVIKTKSGYASAVASDIDQNCGTVVLGTIAGDDTVLVIPFEGQSRETLKFILERLFYQD